VTDMVKKAKVEMHCCVLHTNSIHNSNQQAVHQSDGL